MTTVLEASLENDTPALETLRGSMGHNTNPVWTEDVGNALVHLVPQDAKDILLVGTGLAQPAFRIAEKLSYANVSVVLSQSSELHAAREYEECFAHRATTTPLRRISIIGQPLDLFRRSRPRGAWDVAIFMPFPHKDEPKTLLRTGLIRGCTHFVGPLRDNGTLIVCDLMVRQHACAPNSIAAEIRRKVASGWKRIDAEIAREGSDRRSLTEVLLSDYDFDVAQLNTYPLRKLIYTLYRLSHRESVPKARYNGEHHLVRMQWYQNILMSMNFQVTHTELITPGSFIEMWRHMYGLSLGEAKKLAMLGIIVSKRLSA